ncbi:MAG: c-type cytochrome [Myxococcota bacterium]
MLPSSTPRSSRQESKALRLTTGRRLSLFFVLAASAACSPGESTISGSPSGKSTTAPHASPSPVVEALPLRVPDEAALAGHPAQALIVRGRELALRTAEELPGYVGNGFHCTSCHLQAGTAAHAGPWVGVSSRYPVYRARSGREVTLAERINDCFERSMNGRALPEGGPEMEAMLAYMSWLSEGYPPNHRLEGQGMPRLRLPRAPDLVHGKALYDARCLACHGPTGAGVAVPDGSYAFPALWGERSFNIGAGMARHHTAAGFIRHNMPLGAGNSLTEEEAWDVAGYVVYQPRPDLAEKAKDWPQGGKPEDARY